jgi:2-polyprenyl-3-methyl-5-hydroxy-6-metoxy-1,4-benzoquinol methylase
MEKTRMKIKQIVEEAPKFLSEFYGIPEDTARERIKAGSKIVKEEWEAFDGTFDEFYRSVKNYPFDLAQFNSMFRLEFLVGIFDAIIENRIPLLLTQDYNRPKLLEVGGGGGELSLALSEKFEVTHYDVPSITFDYAKFRGERYGADIRYVNELPDEKFDIVSMMDVFEHIEDVSIFMNHVCDTMKEDALLVSSAYYTSDKHYLHMTLDTPREHMTVAFANAFCLWHTHLMTTEGIKGVEAQSAIGLFRFQETLNFVMEQHKLLLAPKAAATSMQEELETLQIPHLDSLDKINFVVTVG